jgi:peptide deformylase
MKIITLGNKILETVAQPVVNIDNRLISCVQEMFITLDNQKGLGLAAPQIGVSSRFFVASIKEENVRMVCINPRIISFQNSFETLDEGCLSVPGIYAPVSRSKKVTFQYTDINGKEQVIKASGLLARLFQHETDHLDGKLFLRLVDDENLKKIEQDLDLIRKRKKK